MYYFKVSTYVKT